MIHDIDGWTGAFGPRHHPFFNPYLKWVHQETFGRGKPEPWREALFGTDLGHTLPAGPHPDPWRQQLRVMAAVQPARFGLLYAEQLLGLAAAKVAAEQAKNEGMQRALQRRLTAAIDDELCPRPFPDLPKPDGGVGGDDEPRPILWLLQALVTAQQTLPDGALRRELDRLVVQVASPARGG